MNDVMIIDNAMPDSIVEKWKDHYVNDVRLTLCRREADESNPAFLSTMFSLQDMYSVFDCEFRTIKTCVVGAVCREWRGICLTPN